MQSDYSLTMKTPAYQVGGEMNQPNNDAHLGQNSGQLQMTDSTGKYPRCIFVCIIVYCKVLVSFLMHTSCSICVSTYICHILRYICDKFTLCYQRMYILLIICR